MNNKSNNNYPPSAYPDSQYPMSEYGPVRKTSSWQIVIVSVIAVVIVALVTTLVVLIKKGDNGSMMPPPSPMYNAEPGSVMLNGQQITFDVILENGRTYLPVDDFAKAVGYDCVIDDGTIKIMAPTEIYTLNVDDTIVIADDQTAGTKTTIAITTAPFVNG